MSLEVALPGFGRPVLHTALQPRHKSLNATNTRDPPNRVAPTALKDVELGADGIQVSLAPASWNVIRLARSG